MYPRITVVTVNYNLGPYLEAAMRSVLEQNYPNLEYIVVDGGSTDGSVDIIRKYADRLAWWVSEADVGQYHALQKGFERSSGEIMCWLNSDDILHPRALFSVAEIFQTMPEVRWLQGHPTEITDEGATVRRIALPWARWSRQRYLNWDFQFIQQESTFWRRDLWEEAGGSLDTSLALAADMELWARFFRHAKLYTSLTLLGGFRYRNAGVSGAEAQKSRAERKAYLEECREVLRRERKSLSFGRRLSLSVLRPIAFPFGLLFFWDVPFLRFVYERLYGLPPVISYDFEARKYIFNKHLVRYPNRLR